MLKDPKEIKIHKLNLRKITFINLLCRKCAFGKPDIWPVETHSEYKSQH
jgi:hypothetical protein